MRKLFLELIFVLSFININAQNSKFEIGPEIGVNLSHYYYIESQYQDDIIKRMSFGIVAKLNFPKNWALKSKLKYEGKGSQKNYNYGVLIEQRLNYIVVPLLAEWRFGNRNLQGFLNGGAYVAKLLSATKEHNKFDVNKNTDKFNSTDYGAAYGIGAIYKLRKKLKITLDLGGQFGKRSIDTQETNTGWRSIQMFSGNIGLLFGV